MLIFFLIVAILLQKSSFSYCHLQVNYAFVLDFWEVQFFSGYKRRWFNATAARSKTTLFVGRCFTILCYQSSRKKKKFLFRILQLDLPLDLYKPNSPCGVFSLAKTSMSFFWWQRDLIAGMMRKKAASQKPLLYFLQMINILNFDTGGHNKSLKNVSHPVIDSNFCWCWYRIKT